MGLSRILLFLFSIVSFSSSFILLQNRTRRGSNVISTPRRMRNPLPRLRTFSSALHLNIFGMGPTEIVVVAMAAAVIFGPDKLKENLRRKGVKGTVVSAGWRAERTERIERMTAFSTKSRRARAWARINQAIEDENGAVIEKLKEFEENKM